VPRLDEAIARRAGDLPPDHARVLELTVIAGALPQDIVGDAAALAGAAWWSALAALREANLVSTRGPRGGDVVEPYHDRVREAVAARLPLGVAVDHHARLAAALEGRGLGADRPDLLAYHLEGAERPGDAARWTERAGDQAARALAFERAAELYQRTLALAAHAAAHEVSLRARLGGALANAGRGGTAAEVYLAGAALVTGDEALGLRHRAAEQLLRAGHTDQGLEVIDGVLREVGLPAASRRRWPVASLVIQRARLRVRRWRGPARRAGSEDDRRRLACCWSAVVGLTMASPLRMAEYQTRHLRLALAAHDPRRIALGMCFEASASALAGPPAVRAHALLDEARAWAAQADDRVTHAYVAMAEGTVGFLCGRWRDALARCEAAGRTFGDECVGVTWEIGTANHVAMLCRLHMGHIAELRRGVTRALEDADRRGDLYAGTQLRAALQPDMCLMDDRAAAARDELARAELGLSRHEVTLQHWEHMQSSALVELYAGAPGKAIEVIDRRLPRIRRAFLLRIYAVRGFTAYLRSTAWLAALAEGAPDPARLRASIRRACQEFRDDAAARPVPLLLRAGLAVLHGDLDGAAAGYREAAAGFAAVDMAMHVSVARWRLGELLGGDAGCALVDQAGAALAAEGIVRPDRVVAMFAPIAADARRS
jgi:hypothetical protein